MQKKLFLIDFIVLLNLLSRDYNSLNEVNYNKKTLIMKVLSSNKF